MQINDKIKKETSDMNESYSLRKNFFESQSISQLVTPSPLIALCSLTSKIPRSPRQTIHNSEAPEPNEITPASQPCKNYGRNLSLNTPTPTRNTSNIRRRSLPRHIKAAKQIKHTFKENNKETVPVKGNESERGLNEIRGHVSYLSGGACLPPGGICSICKMHVKNLAFHKTLHDHANKRKKKSRLSKPNTTSTHTF